MSIYENLKIHGITLPAVPTPVAAFVPHVRAGNLVYVSGHIARRDGKPWVGQLGAQVTTEEGREAARGVAVDLLAALHSAVGDLNTINRIVKLTVLVNSVASYTEQHLVANGASELLLKLFGPIGAHTR